MPDLIGLEVRLEFVHLFLALVLIAGLVLVVFVAYRGSQPMQIAGADWSQPRGSIRRL